MSQIPRMKIIKNRIATTLYPLARLCLRCFPIHAKKREMWHLIRRRIGWRSYECLIESDHAFVVKGDVSEFIHQRLYFFGVWEPCITQFIKARLKPGDCFIDVGANIGYYSLLSASLVGKTGRIVAIEASPKVYAHLIENLHLNGVQNVLALNVAASDSPGELNLFEGDNCLQITTSASWAREWKCSFVGKVQALPLEMLVSKEELRAARIIKIDVEGAEWNVCKGLMPVIHELPRHAEIILELTPSEIESQGHQCSELIRQFTDLGFFPYTIENGYSENDLFSENKECRPHRLDSVYLKNQTDLVFSRIDAVHL
jgi:FkbM family methyltransferase